MTYSVVWQTQAEQNLADIWLAASDRNTIFSTANRLDQYLSRDPLHHGR